MNYNFFIVGGDKRINLLAKKLLKDKNGVYTFANEIDGATEIDKKENIKNYNYDIVISSMPLSKDNMKQESVIVPIPNHNRGEIFSLKNKRAINEVITISKLLSKLALAALVEERPNIIKMGAAISKTTIPITYGKSFLVNLFSFFVLFLKIKRKR